MSSKDVLIASSGAGPCGRSLWISRHLMNLFPQPVIYSNFCKRYSANSAPHALYFDRVLSDMRDSGEIWDYVNGTSLPNLDSQGLLVGKTVLVPPLAILEAFAHTLGIVYGRLYSTEASRLSELRDELLPRLLNGELEQVGNHN